MLQTSTAALHQARVTTLRARPSTTNLLLRQLIARLAGQDRALQSQIICHATSTPTAHPPAGHRGRATHPPKTRPAFLIGLCHIPPQLTRRSLGNGRSSAWHRLTVSMALKLKVRRPCQAPLSTSSPPILLARNSQRSMSWLKTLVWLTPCWTRKSASSRKRA